MDHITKRAVADTAAAIWEYDPSLESNKVAGGRPDVLSVLRTIDVKVSLIFLTSTNSIISIDQFFTTTCTVFRGPAN